MNASAEAPFFLRNAALLNLSSSFAIEPTQQGCQLLGQKSFEPLKKNKKRLNKPEQLEQLEQLAVQAAEEIFCRTPEQTCWGTDWSHFSGMPCPKRQLTGTTKYLRVGCKWKAMHWVQPIVW